MADNNSLLEKIEWYTQEGERYFQAICASSSFPDFREAFYQYLLCRFMIREDSKENNLLKLALRSNDEMCPRHTGDRTATFCTPTTACIQTWSFEKRHCLSCIWKKSWASVWTMIWQAMWRRWTSWPRPSGFSSARPESTELTGGFA